MSDKEIGPLIDNEKNSQDVYLNEETNINLETLNTKMVSLKTTIYVLLHIIKNRNLDLLIFLSQVNYVQRIN